MANVLEKLAVTVEAAAVNRISEIKVQAKLARYRFFLHVQPPCLLSQ
jgi:hypothetical protein